MSQVRKKSGAARPGGMLPDELVRFRPDLNLWARLRIMSADDTPSTSRFVIRDFDAAGLARFVAAQLATHFPDGRQPDADGLLEPVQQALARTRQCFAGIARAKYRDGDAVLYNPLHPDHHAVFLCLLANVLASRDAQDPRAFRLYYLNKILHGLDAYPDIRLPEVFQFMHPLGTVLGHAQYGNHFCVYQGCTVGSDEAGRCPELGDGVVLYAGASVIGRCRIGDNVVIGAGCCLIDTDVPSNTVVRLRPGSFEMLPNERSVSERRFR